MQKSISLLEGLALLMLPIIIIVSALRGFSGTRLWMILTALLGIIPFFLSLEKESPKAREVLPVVIFAALAASSRVLFAPFPNVKPITAVILTAGVSLGGRAGFLAGVLAAFSSNIFFGQGPWTPLQMYSWGIVGLIAGLAGGNGKTSTNVDNKKTIFKSRLACLLWGFLSALLYGFILDTWYIASYISNPSLSSALLAYAAGIPGNITHGISTAMFFSLICPSWTKMIGRIRRKYGLESG